MKETSKKIREAIKNRAIREFLTGLKESTLNDIEHIDERTGFNIIHFCVQEKAAKELTLIIGHYPKVNLEIKTQGLVHRTAVELAMSLGHARVCKVLIDKGAVVSADIAKEARKNFKNDAMFVAFIDDLLKQSEKKKKGFFTFYQF